MHFIEWFEKWNEDIEIARQDAIKLMTERQEMSDRIQTVCGFPIELSMLICDYLSQLPKVLSILIPIVFYVLIS